MGTDPAFPIDIDVCLFAIFIDGCLLVEVIDLKVEGILFLRSDVFVIVKPKLGILGNIREDDGTGGFSKYIPHGEVE